MLHERLRTAKVEANYPGMTASQAVEHELRDSIKEKGQGFAGEMKWWLVRQEQGLKKRSEGWVDRMWDAAERMLPTDEELAQKWMLSVVRKTLVDEKVISGGYYDKEGQKTDKYFRLAQSVERNWSRFNQGGLNEALVAVENKPRVKVVKADVGEDKFIGQLTGAYEALKNSKLAKGMVGGAVVATILAACAGGGYTSQPQVYETAPVPVDVPTLNPSPTPESGVVSPAPVEPEATPTVPPRRENSGGTYSTEQWSLIEGGAFAGQEAVLTDWVVNYWGSDQIAERAFFPVEPGNFSELQFKYLFDETDPNSALVLLESADGRLWSLPIRINSTEFEFITVHPDASVGFIEAGQGPLLLTPSGTTEGGQPWRLANFGGELVRMSGDEIVGTINHEGDGGWVMDEVLPTPVPDIFVGFDTMPASEAEALANCPVAPDPINDTDAFLAWREEYRARIANSLLPVGYESQSRGQISTDYIVNIPDGLSYGCYRFEHEGQGYVMVTIRFPDGLGIDPPYGDFLVDRNNPIFTVDRVLSALDGGGRVRLMRILDVLAFYDGRDGVHGVGDATTLLELMAAVPDIHGLQVRSLGD